MISAVLLMVLFMAGFGGILIYREKQGENRPETIRMIIFITLGTIVFISIVMGLLMVRNFQ